MEVSIKEERAWHSRPSVPKSPLPKRPFVSARSRSLLDHSRERYDHYEETIYDINGVLTWTVDGKKIDVGPGQALCVPAF